MNARGESVGHRGAAARGAAWVAIALASASMVGGCDVVTSVGPQTCDFDESENPAVTYRGGTVEGGVYTSSPWNEALVYFPGGAQVRFEHGLGQVPRAWSAYVSFDPEGTAGGGSLAPAAGNQAELQAIDDVAITLRNSSCADYYVIVTAQIGSAPSPPVDG